MEHEQEAFDDAGFLELLGAVVLHHGTGVVSVRIHVRGGMPWAVSAQFENADEKVA